MYRKNGGNLKKNTELTKSIKLKILFVLILSNASMALLMSNDVPTYRPQPSQQYLRKGYITLKIKARLKTKFDKLVPVTITDKSHKNVIKDAFILEKIEFEHENLIEQLGQQYIVEIKKRDFPKLSKMKEKLIYPYQLKFPSLNRRSYEILF